ncbi:XRE family transcriptional regulator [Escherichia coli]|nr:XRE family transcriptional regulator [Escherichia coli]
MFPQHKLASGKKGNTCPLIWKKKFRNITQIGDYSPQLVEWTGSVANAEKWDRLIHFLARRAMDDAETGYITQLLTDEDGFLVEETIDVLKRIGFPTPLSFPEGLNIDDDNADEEEAFWEILESNAHCSVINDIYHALNDVYGFYIAYVDELIQDDDLDVYSSEAINIQSSLISLAACKIEIDTPVASNFKEFRYRVKKDYENWLNQLKMMAFRAGIPLRAELLEMVYNTADQLSVAAEAERFDFNKSRIHPDIYMNEILTGMRIIHQVLPVIMQKLEITDFKLDETDLCLGK